MSTSRHSLKNLLLTGRPGVGKTSVLQALADEFRDMAGGFTTGEIRACGVRKGFRVTALDGASAVFAHADFPGPVCVGKYGVDLPAFERIALPALRDALDHRKIVVIDEIGKMELASPCFCDLVREVLDSPLIVLATVMEKPHPFADDLKKRPDVDVIQVTRDNRERLPPRIAGIAREMLQVPPAYCNV